jgi:hypothetical protein
LVVRRDVAALCHGQQFVDAVGYVIRCSSLMQIEPALVLTGDSRLHGWSGSLSIPGIAAEGNRVTAGAVDHLGIVTRTLSQPLGTSGTTSYLSFVVRPEGALHEGLFNGFFGLELNASTGDSLFIGKPGGGALNQFVLETGGGAQQHASGVNAVVDEEFLLVVRADFSDGNDQSTLYVNPTVGAAEPLSGTIRYDSDVGVVDSLLIFSTDAFSIDEIRVGASYADVTPVSPLLPVDAPDYVVWRKNPDASGGNPDGYNTWHANFG